MKENWRNKGVYWLITLMGLILACQHEDSHRHAAGEGYTCPMHPQIVQDKPGTCPICHMDLVKRTSVPDSTGGSHAGGHAGDQGQADLESLLKPVHSRVVSSITTIHPTKGSRESTLELPGRIEYDARRLQVVSARFGGRIEKLYVRYNYQPVRKGQKLLEIYSPELLTAQQELLFLLENDAGHAALIASARQKLSLLGLTTAQIHQIAKSRKAQYRLALFSPYSGYVVENTGPAPWSATAPPPNESMGGMSGATQPIGAAPALPAVAPNTPLSITEGAYLRAGAPVFRVVNTDQVWAVFRSYPGEVSQLKPGLPVEITPESDPRRRINGRLDLIEPFFREGGNTATLRVHLDNPGGRLQSGQLLTGKIRVKSDVGLWLPRSAVLDAGNRRVVFVKQENALRPLTVQTGIVLRDSIQILSGLSPQQAVAAQAAYLIDSESFLREDSQ